MVHYVEFEHVRNVTNNFPYSDNVTGIHVVIMLEVSISIVHMHDLMC